MKTSRKLRILAVARQRTACGFYRVWLPARIMRKLGHDVTCIENASYYDIMKPDMERWVQENLGKFSYPVIHFLPPYNSWQRIEGSILN